MTPQRVSPIVASPAKLSMAEARESLGIADDSMRPRFGVKGAAAGTWLAQQGLPVPEHFNSWLELSGTDFIARLGRHEYLVEGAHAAALEHAALCFPGDVYPAPRDDAALLLCGRKLPALLRQTCNVNFAALDVQAKPVLLTSMVGVSVLILPALHSGAPFYRVWCDYSYGDYLWSTLLGIVIELGGGVMDLPAEFQG